MDRGVRLEPPTPRRETVVRPRLLDRLRDRFTVPITVVVAPAGFGKTTLLAQAVWENRLTPLGADCWLTCSPDDVAGSSLAEGLCRSLGVPPPSSPGVEGAAATVVDAIWHRSPSEVALVLDDVHEIPAGSPGAALLTRLLVALPRNGHVVLSGRRPPPVALARREVQGEVARLGEADLAFTGDELTAFATQRNVPPDQLGSSGGWPALAEIAATARAGVDARYIWEEVLAGIDPDRRRALAVLAHIGPFDDGLASAALGREVDVAALTANLPLVETTPGGARQIHPLWREHLAGTVAPQEIVEARRRVGLALTPTGNVAAAVRLLIEAGAWDDMAGVVADILGAAHPPVPGDLVTTWLGRLPDHMASGPLGRLLDAAGAVQGDPVAAARYLEEAAEAFRREGNSAGELACMAQLAQVAWWSEQPERLAGLAARLFEMEARDEDGAKPLACLARALIADLAANCTLELAELDRIPAGSLNQTMQSLVDWLRSTSLHHLGRGPEALEAAHRASARAAPLHAPVVDSARLQALWFLGHVDQVLDELPAMVDRTEATGLRDYTALMASVSCMAHAVVGRVDTAAAYLERARASTASPDLPLVDVNLVICEASVAVASGDEQNAVDILHAYLERGPSFGAGLAAFPQRRSLTLWYVLVPSTRPYWDEVDLGPTYVTVRDLARAVVQVRTDGRLAAGAADLPDPGVVRAVLPLPWATELALAHVAAGHKAGWDLLDALWPDAQPEVRRRADGRAASSESTSRSTSSSLGRAARTALVRLPVPPRGRLDLELLGPVELRRDGEPIDGPEWRRERVRSLLAHLVLHRPVGRERLATDLWPSFDAEAQSRNLRVTLTHLLRVLEPERSERDASFLIRPHGGGLMLHRGEWLDVDVWRFDDLWQRATEADRRGLPSVALDAMQEAVGLWRDDPSELAGEDWALAEVEERRLRLVGLAARAGELLLARDEPEGARRMGEVALRTDEWSERAHQIVVSAHLAIGDHRAARRALDRYRQMLVDLGVDQPEIDRHLARLAPPARQQRLSRAPTR